MLFYVRLSPAKALMLSQGPAGSLWLGVADPLEPTSAAAARAESPAARGAASGSEPPLFRKALKPASQPTGHRAAPARQR
jgi:hypothetical protein